MASSSGLISVYRPVPFPALRDLRVNLSIRGWGDSSPLRKWGRSHAHARGLGCRSITGRIQALGTSSTRPRGYARQPFVEPQWLLSSNEVDNLRATSERDKVEESTSGRSWLSGKTIEENQPGALYYIVINTAKDEKSSLSEPNSGILLSMISENGKAIMERIPGIKLGCLQTGEVAVKQFRFQRGAVDVVTVVGPDLGSLAALWIAPEAGTWRLDDISVTILPWVGELANNDLLAREDLTSLITSDKVKETASVIEWKGVVHHFESSEALLGDGAWMAAAELKPSSIQETSNPVDLQEKLLKLSPKLGRSAQGVARLREESMNEYANLKLSLLGFSSVLVVAGMASLAALGQGKLAEGFGVGGVVGFFYLLLLQRAVDQLPGSMPAEFSEAESEKPTLKTLKDDTDTPRQLMEANDKEVETGAMLPGQPRSLGTVETSRSIVSGDNGFRGRVALIAIVAFLVGRLAQGGSESTLAPPELLAGVFGFLTSKVAVVLAALKLSSSGDK